jgi:small subunit ribosomal protein S2
MRRYIFGERGGIYIIDLTKTQELLEEAHDFARNVAERNGTILFVGTKKQAQNAVAENASRVGMPYVSNRWLGGFLFLLPDFLFAITAISFHSIN